MKTRTFLLPIKFHPKLRTPELALFDRPLPDSAHELVDTSEEYYYNTYFHV